MLEHISLFTSAKSAGSALAIAMALATTPSLAGPEIPLRTTLKARVGEFYTAYLGSDWEALLGLMAPFVRECGSAEDLRLGWAEDGLVRILSWRLVDVEYDSSYVGRDFEVECMGQTYHVDAGALTVVSQRDQRGDEKPKRGKNYIRWVFIGGVWYAAGPI